ncbi:MAG: hypothetical protein DI553_13605, partial [Cutibacterium acnes]
MPPATPPSTAWQAAEGLVVPTGGDFAELPATMAAQPSLQDSLRTLLHGLLARTGAVRAVLLWYEGGHAGQAVDARAANADGRQPASTLTVDQPDTRLKDAAEEAIDQGM